MFRISQRRSRRGVRLSSLLAISLVGIGVSVGMSAKTLAPSSDAKHTSTHFKGPKANKGTVTHTREGAMKVLTLSQDFVVPDTPAPHWQVVDSKGNVYLLQRLLIKGDHYNQKIVVPPFVADVARVQIWCAWAETLLGEASFSMPVK